MLAFCLFHVYNFSRTLVRILNTGKKVIEQASIFRPGLLYFKFLLAGFVSKLIVVSKLIA